MSHLPFLTVDADRTSTEVDERSSQLPASSLRPRPSQNASSGILPQIVRFPLAVIIALGTSAGLYSVAADITGYELSTVSKSLDEPWQILAVVGWRIAELYISWASGFDFWDVASLTLLTVTPYHSLLYLFYSISPASVLMSLSIDLLSSVLPFALLRPLASYNNPPGSAPASTQLSTSFTVKLYVSIFLSVLYSVFIFSSIQSVLPRYIVTYFDVRTLEPAYAATLPILLTAAVPLGNAAKDLLYVPSTYLAKASHQETHFDPKTATLGETLAYNVGLSGWGKREDILLRRTLLLAGMTVSTSVAKIYGTVAGAELPGAAIWGGVWAAAGLLAGVGISYVGDV